MYEMINQTYSGITNFFMTHPIICISIILYILLFILLSIIKFWDKLNMPFTAQLQNFFLFLYLPLLLPISIVGTIGHTLFALTRTHTSAFIRSLLRIVLLPFTLFSIIGNQFEQIKITNWLKYCKERAITLFKHYIGRNSVKEKLKIYQQYTKDLVSIDGSFLRDYYAEKRYKFLAFLLQVVSFFTTYAGVEIFFGDLFDLAPLFITLVIQVGLYSTAVTTNKPGKKSGRGKTVKYLLTCISIIFSYIGLITLASPPEDSYKFAYQEYKSAFENVLDSLNAANISPEDSADLLNLEFRNIFSTLSQLDNEINNTLQYLRTITSEGIPEETYQSSFYSQTHADGTQIKESTRTENTNYASYIDHNDELASLTNTRNDLLKAIGEYTGINTLPFEIKFNNSGNVDILTNNDADKSLISYEDINVDYATIQNFFSHEYFLQLLTDDDIQALKQLTFLINANNTALKNTYIQTDSSQIDENLINSILEENKTHDALSQLFLPEWEELTTDFDSNASNVKDVLITIGNLLGADLNNTDMRKLLVLRQTMQEEVSNSYLSIQPYLTNTDPALAIQLDSCKQSVEEIPNILWIGFKRFLTKGVHQSNAFICLALALFNDIFTLLLGWAGSRKAYSFLYVKSSKDYYNDIDELFGVVFKSMMQNFYLSIKKGSFTNMSSDDFTQECICTILKTSKTITSFLNRFELSECTCSMGYNLKLQYNLSDNNIKEYQPIISVLLKTDMIKIIPTIQYRYIELEYYCGIHLPLSENTTEGSFDTYKPNLDNAQSQGNTLLLRNRAENYLRENMCVDIACSSTQSPQHT